LVVQTTLDPHLQAIADEALRRGLIRYDRRHGWRGPVARYVTSEADLEAAEADRAQAREDRVADRLAGRAEGWRRLPPVALLVPEEDWQIFLAEVPIDPLPKVDLVKNWELAVVLDPEAGGRQALIGLEDGSTGVIPRPEVEWARAWLPNQRVGGKPAKPSAVLDRGDIVLVEHGVEDLLAPALRPQHTCSTQQPEVVADQRGGDAQLFGDVARCDLPVHTGHYDRQAGRIRQQAEGLGKLGHLVGLDVNVLHN